MKRVSFGTAVIVVIMCLSYCSNKPMHPKTYDAGIALAVQEDVLKTSIERRLTALEMVEVAPANGRPHIEAVSASEAVYYNARQKQPPE